MEFCGQHGPVASFRIENLDWRQSIFAIISPKHINLATTNSGSKRTPRHIQTLRLLPFLPKYIITLTASHALILAIIPTNNINFPIQINTGMFLPAIHHTFFLLQNIWLSWAEEVTVVGGSASGYEDLAGWKSARWCVILDLCVVYCCETVDVVYWA